MDYYSLWLEEKVFSILKETRTALIAAFVKKHVQLMKQD
jgi:hypothetical protein